jgi:GxxExxY protein
MEIIRKMASSVYAELGSGHSEAVYQKACEVFLRLSGSHYDAQSDVPVFYQGHQVGRGIIDLVLFGDDTKTIIELKAVGAKVGQAEKRQLRNYLILTNTEDGVIVNFGQPGANKQGVLSVEFVNKNTGDGTEVEEDDEEQPLFP